MARYARTRRGQHGTPTGLDALAQMINDALVAMGTRPAFALALHSQAIDSTPVAHKPSPVRRPSRNVRPTPHPAAAPPPPDDAPADQSGTDAGTDTGSSEIDETHVETWRLVRLAQAGDGEAFGQLYDRYVDTVFRFIYYRVNDRALAEDFTSETFLRALRRIGTITYQGRDIGAWFITIARNIVLDHLKSARHRLELTTAEILEGKEHAQSTESAVLDLLQSERLMEAVAKLGDEQRECVMLRFVHGLSVNETAGVMGKNDGAIKALQHRAVRKLADLIGGDLR
jgi:RNA polymerase sigma-70 factor (ECF subfamily)